MSEAAPARPTRVRYLVLASACSLAVVTYIHRVGFATASAEFREPLGLRDGQMGALMAAFLLAYGLFEMPWGYLGDRFGVRDVLSAVILGGSVTTGLLALVGLMPRGATWAFPLLLLLRFLFGAFQAGTFPAISRMMTDWMPVTERGSAQGFVWMSSRTGGALAPYLLVGLIQGLGNWMLPLALVAALGLAWCAGFRPWFRNHPEEMARVNAAERARIVAGRPVRPVGHGDVPWGRMFRSRSVWALCLMYGFLGYSGNFFVTLLPTYLKSHRHLDAATAGRLTSLPFACGVAACLLGGWLSDAIIRRRGVRWGRRLVGLAGLGVAGVAILGTIWVTDVALLGTLLSLTFSGNDLAMGPAWAAAADIGERHAGTLSGAMNMVSSVMAAGGALATGALLEAGHPTVPFVLFAISYGLGTLCWFAVDVSQTLSEPQPA